MSQIIFYEKPGCGNNSKQKTMLTAAGHTVIARDLLTEPWTSDRLRAFFGSRPVAEWFNRAAPRIKSEEIIPEKLNAETALQLMLQDPLLIRRPLMEANNRREAGFEYALVNAWVGLVAVAEPSNLESCPKSHIATPCHTR